MKYINYKPPFALRLFTFTKRFINHILWLNTILICAYLFLGNSNTIYLDFLCFVLLIGAILNLRYSLKRNTISQNNNSKPQNKYIYLIKLWKSKLLNTYSIKPINSFKEQAIHLTEFLVKEKPYLDPNLTINSLAEMMDISRRDLSVIINKGLHQNFYELINEVRVIETMEYLKNPENQKMNVLEIMYEVGFCSKSSFNVAFKKYTGLTPSQYRKRCFSKKDKC